MCFFFASSVLSGFVFSFFSTFVIWVELPYCSACGEWITWRPLTDLIYRLIIVGIVFRSTPSSLKRSASIRHVAAAAFTADSRRFILFTYIVIFVLVILVTWFQGIKRVVRNIFYTLVVIVNASCTLRMLSYHPTVIASYCVFHEKYGVDLEMVFQGLACLANVLYSFPL